MYTNTWAIHCRYRKSPHCVAEMCAWESLKLFWGRTNPHHGALLVETWRTVSVGSTLGERGATSPTLSKLALAGPARSTPPQPPSLGRMVFVGRVQLGRESTPCLKASAHWCLVSPLSILSAFVYAERLRQRVGRYQRTVRTLHRSEPLKFCFVLIGVNSYFVCHRSFTAPMIHLQCFEGFSWAVIL